MPILINPPVEGNEAALVKGTVCWAAVMSALRVLNAVENGSPVLGGTGPSMGSTVLLIGVMSLYAPPSSI